MNLKYLVVGMLLIFISFISFAQQFTFKNLTGFYDVKLFETIFGTIESVAKIKFGETGGTFTIAYLQNGTEPIYFKTYTSEYPVIVNVSFKPDIFGTIIPRNITVKIVNMSNGEFVYERQFRLEPLLFNIPDISILATIIFYLLLVIFVVDFLPKRIILHLLNSSLRLFKLKNVKFSKRIIFDNIFVKVLNYTVIAFAVLIAITLLSVVSISYYLWDILRTVIQIISIILSTILSVSLVIFIIQLLYVLIKRINYKINFVPLFLSYTALLLLVLYYMMFSIPLTIFGGELIKNSIVSTVSQNSNLGFYLDKSIDLLNNSVFTIFDPFVKTYLPLFMLMYFVVFVYMFSKLLWNLILNL